MFSGLEFEYPYFLAVVIPFIICAYFCKIKSASYYIPHLHIFRKSETVQNNLLQILKWSAIIFAIIALASPIQKLSNDRVNKDGFDIVLNLDTSGSMRQRGFNPNNPKQNRWQVVQSLVGDFIEKRVNDNIALVVFGNSVMTASPLSFDKKTQKEILSYLNIGVVGRETALLDSIASSVKILKESKAKSKILITLTDGEDTASEIPHTVIIKLLKKYNIKTYTIGIGESNRYLLDTIAKESNGKFFSARNKNDLKNIYETIDKLEKSKIEQEKIIYKKYYFFYPLFLSIMSLILFIYLKNKKDL